MPQAARLVARVFTGTSSVSPQKFSPHTNTARHARRPPTAANNNERSADKRLPVYDCQKDCTARQQVILVCTGHLKIILVQGIPEEELVHKQTITDCLNTNCCGEVGKSSQLLPTHERQHTNECDEQQIQILSYLSK